MAKLKFKKQSNKSLSIKSINDLLKVLNILASFTVAIFSLTFAFFTSYSPGFFGNHTPLITETSWYVFLLIAIPAGLIFHFSLTHQRVERSYVVTLLIYTVFTVVLLIVLPFMGMSVIGRNLYGFEAQPFIPNLTIWLSLLLGWLYLTMLYKNKS